MKNTNKNLELMWAAGFFDGEGNAFLQRVMSKKGKAYSYPIISVTQYYDPFVLYRFQEAMGGIGKISQPNRNKPQIYTWKAHNRADNLKAYELLIDRCSPVKQKQLSDVFKKGVSNFPDV